ncbi:hypothetical protein Tco_0472789 [Tanacetum coccineum]
MDSEVSFQRSYHFVTGLEEEQMWEDDDFGECDRECTERFGVSLKKASEMVDLVDEVLDEGLADYPDEAGFIRVEDDQGTEDIGGLLDGVQNYVSHKTSDIPDIEGLLNMMVKLCEI